MNGKRYQKVANKMGKTANAKKVFQTRKRVGKKMAILTLQDGFPAIAGLVYARVDEKLLKPGQF